MNSISISGKVIKSTEMNKESLGVTLDLGLIDIPEANIFGYQNNVFMVIDLTATPKVTKESVFTEGDFLSISDCKMSVVLIEDSENPGSVFEKNIIKAPTTSVLISKAKIIRINLVNFTAQVEQVINSHTVLVSGEKRINGVITIVKNGKNLKVGDRIQLCGDVILMPEGYNKHSCYGKHGFYADALPVTRGIGD